MTTIWTYTCLSCNRTWRLRPPIIDQDGAHRDRHNEPCTGEIQASPVSLGKVPHVLAPEDVASDDGIAPEGPTADGR